MVETQHRPTGGTLEAVAAGGELRYHAVVARGLLERFNASPSASAWAARWPPCAPLLEDAWNAAESVDGEALVGRLQSTAAHLYGESSGFTSAIAHELAAAALASGWRSHEQGLSAADDYLRRDDLDHLRRCSAAVAPETEQEIPVGVTLTPFREGHTASVIRVCVEYAAADVEFALNVARDLGDAAVELEATTAELARWHALECRRAPRVLDVGSGRCRVLGEPASIPIVAVEFLEDADELHVVEDPLARGRGRFLRVEEFGHSPHVSLAMQGELLSRRRSNALWCEVIEWCTRAASIDWDQRTMNAPRVELNDGDAVLRDGRSIAFVGSSAQRFADDLGAWPWEAMLSSANSDLDVEGRLAWAAPRQALAAIRRALLAMYPANPATATAGYALMLQLATGRQAEGASSQARTALQRELDAWGRQAAASKH